MKKVMIDCDVGVDDALALILAFHSSELDLKAVTAVNGNVPVDKAFENIRKVLCLIRPRQKPIIAKGAGRPLKGEPVYAYSIHGKDGLGGAKFEREEGEEWWQIDPDPAYELFAEMARQYPNEVTLIATGPLTNLALGLQRDEEGMRRLKEVVIMGGAVRTGGNMTPDAEFNLFVDPLAARRVFESGLPITLVPLDVTHQVFLTPRVMEERVKPLRNAFAQFMTEATGYHSIVRRFKGGKVFHLHDPLAVGVVLDPALVTTEQLSLDVDVQEGEHYGRISEVPGKPKIEVCLEVDSKRFLDLFLSRIG